ncbi:MAG: hypothetical protein ACKOBV_04480, partial [Candidatus Kapaibacterium sp.]
QRSLARNSSLSDVYGALAEIERSKNNELKAREFENEFVKRTGRLPSYTHEPVTLSETISDDSEPLSLSATEESLSENTAMAAATSDSGATTDARIDAVTRELRSMQSGAEPRNVKSDSRADTKLPAWFLPSLSGLAAAIALISFVLLRGYMRWRRQQLRIVAAASDGSLMPPSADDTRTPSFDTDLHSAMAVQENVATAKYKAQELDAIAVPQDVAERTRATFFDEAASDDAASDIVASPASDTSTSESAGDGGLFDFSEAFYAARERTVERRRSELSGLTVTPPLDSPVLAGDTPAQVSGDDAAATGGADRRGVRTGSGTGSGTGSMGTSPPAPAFESGRAIPYPVGQSRMLDVDEESIANLARQIGIDPAIIKAQRRSRKGDQAPRNSADELSENTR